MRISDWSSDVCSSDLGARAGELDKVVAVGPEAQVVLTNAGEPRLRQVSRLLGARALGAVQTLSRGTKLERVRHDRGNVQLARQIVLAGVADIDPGLPQVVQFLAQQLGDRDCRVVDIALACDGLAASDQPSDLHERLFGVRLAHRSERLQDRSEEHTSELQSLMRTSYAVFCLKQKN